MLKMRLRVSPCRARCSPRSVGRLTTIVPSSCSTCISRETRCSSSPLGPFTRTSSGSMNTSTPVGTGMGSFPIRLMARSPDVRDHFAADALPASVVARHHALGGGHDGSAHSAENLRYLTGRHVLAATRPRHALEAGDHRRALLRVLEPHAQRLADAGGLGGEVLDVALLLEDAGHLVLELGVRHVHVLEVGLETVPNTSEEIGERVGHRHGSTSSTS